MLPSLYENENTRNSPALLTGSHQRSIDGPNLEQCGDTTTGMPCKRQAGGGHHGKNNNNWCGEENKAIREKFKAAFKKIQNDPELVAAQKSLESARTSLEQTRTKLLLKVDPSLADAIKKNEARRAQWQNHKGEWKKNCGTNGKCKPAQAAPASTPAPATNP